MAHSWTLSFTAGRLTYSVVAVGRLLKPRPIVLLVEQGVVSGLEQGEFRPKLNLPHHTYKLMFDLAGVSCNSSDVAARPNWFRSK